VYWDPPDTDKENAAYRICPRRLSTSIGYHLRIAGRPARIDTLARVLDYLADLGDEVWVARRRDIARFWREHYPR